MTSLNLCNIKPDSVAITNESANELISLKVTSCPVDTLDYITRFTFPKLQILAFCDMKLNDNQVGMLLSCIKKSSKKLRRIELNDNEIKSLDLALFAGLESVVICGNRIEDVNIGAETTLELQNLILKNNRIAYISDKVWRSCSETLAILDLRGNSLINLSYSFFLLSHIKVLNLNGNTDLNASCIRKLGSFGSLIELGLSGIRLGSIGIDWLLALNNLQELDLSDCDIDSEALSEVLGNCFMLRRLVASKNRVSNIDLEDLNVQLKYLDLSHNSIDKNGFKALTMFHQLEVLDLSHNKIVGDLDLDEFEFQALNHLDLRSNSLASFTISNNQAGRYQRIDLRGNPSINVEEKLFPSCCWFDDNLMAEIQMFKRKSGYLSERSSSIMHSEAAAPPSRIVNKDEEVSAPKQRLSFPEGIKLGGDYDFNTASATGICMAELFSTKDELAFKPIEIGSELRWFSDACVILVHSIGPENRLIYLWCGEDCNASLKSMATLYVLCLREFLGIKNSTEHLPTACPSIEVIRKIQIIKRSQPIQREKPAYEDIVRIFLYKKGRVYRIPLSYDFLKQENGSYVIETESMVFVYTKAGVPSVACTLLAKQLASNGYKQKIFHVLRDISGFLDQLQVPSCKLDFSSHQKKPRLFLFRDTGSGFSLTSKTYSRFTSDLLSSSQSYIVETFTDIFLWTGSRSNISMQKKAELLDIANKLLNDKQNAHPSYASIQCEYDGSETAWFKMQFESWEMAKIRQSSLDLESKRDSKTKEPILIVEDMFCDSTVQEDQEIYETMILDASNESVVRVDLNLDYFVFNQAHIYLVVQVDTKRNKGVLYSWRGDSCPKQLFLQLTSLVMQVKNTVLSEYTELENLEEKQVEGFDLNDYPNMLANFPDILLVESDNASSAKYNIVECMGKIFIICSELQSVPADGKVEIIDGTANINCSAEMFTQVKDCLTTELRIKGTRHIPLQEQIRLYLISSGQDRTKYPLWTAERCMFTTKDHMKNAHLLVKKRIDGEEVILQKGNDIATNIFALKLAEEYSRLCKLRYNIVCAVSDNGSVSGNSCPGEAGR